MVCEKKVVMNVTAFLHTKVCKRSCQWQVLCIKSYIVKNMSVGTMHKKTLVIYCNQYKIHKEEEYGC